MFRKLRTIFFVSIPVFIAHGIEEYLTGFTEVDAIFTFLFQPVLKMSVEQGTFVVFQVMAAILLIVSGLLLLGEKWHKRLLILPGILYIFELHHLVEAIIRWEYYPGLITSLVFPILGFLFWKEWYRSLRS